VSAVFHISRRRLLLALAGAVGLRALPGLADEKPPSDRGIGGTGISSLPDEGRAIGFIGSIQGFGSIYVNGERIAYAKDVAVTIDGRRSRPADMLIGQVVKTVAARGKSGLVTDRIDILSEVVGPVEALEGESMVVLGQRVHLGTTGSSAFALGQRVAVSGLRRPDGEIVARLVEPAGARRDQVVGLATFRGWTLQIGGLELFGPDARYDGRRVVVRGSRTPRGLKVTSIALDGLPDGAGVRTLSIEAYLSRRGTDLELGTGIVIADPSGQIDTGGGDQPAIVKIDLGPGGTLHFGGMGGGGGQPSWPQQGPAGEQPAIRPNEGPNAPTSGPSMPGGRAASTFAPGFAAGAAMAGPSGPGPGGGFAGPPGPGKP
jgi:hypothetical protein